MKTKAGHRDWKGENNPNYQGVWPKRRTQLEAWCKEGLTLQEMAERFRCNTRHVRQYIQEYAIPYEIRGWEGVNNPAWKGGRITAGRGYVKVYAPTHPHRDQHNKVWEHRLVMERMIGRYLEPNERVHHIDDNPGNNSPGNLKLYSSNAAHLAETLKGKVPNWTEKGRRRLARVLNHRDANGDLAPIPPGTEIDDLPVSEAIYRKLTARAGVGHIPSKTAPLTS